MPTRPARTPRTRLALFVGLALVVLVGGSLLLRGGDERTKLTLDQFEEAVGAGRVATATIEDRDHAVVGELAGGESYKVSFPEQYGDELTRLLRRNDVELDTDQQKESVWVALLFNVLPILLLFGLFLFFLSSSQAGGRMAQFGKAKARRSSPDSPKVTFAPRRRLRSPSSPRRPPQRSRPSRPS